MLSSIPASIISGLNVTQWALISDLLWGFRFLILRTLPPYFMDARCLSLDFYHTMLARYGMSYEYSVANSV